jgi:hypothetical protein
LTSQRKQGSRVVDVRFSRGGVITEVCCGFLIE